MSGGRHSLALVFCSDWRGEAQGGNWSRVGLLVKRVLVSLAHLYGNLLSGFLWISIGFGKAGSIQMRSCPKRPTGELFPVTDKL